MTTRKKKPQEVYTLLALEVIEFHSTISAGINYKARDKHFYDENPKVFEFESSVVIEGRCYYPSERANMPYTITIYGQELWDGEFTKKLDHYQVRREDGSRKYLTVRGEQVPVFKVPRGIGHVEKVWGKPRWTATAFIAPECLSDMLNLLPNVRPLYVSIHEMREGRRRSIVSLTLQTNDPVEE